MGAGETMPLEAPSSREVRARYHLSSLQTGMIHIKSYLFHLRSIHQLQYFLRNQFPFRIPIALNQTDTNTNTNKVNYKRWRNSRKSLTSY